MSHATADYVVNMFRLLQVLLKLAGRKENTSRTMPPDFCGTFENVFMPANHPPRAMLDDRLSPGAAVPSGNPRAFTVKVYTRDQLRAKGSKARKPHRIFAVCECGKEIPAGKLNQHMKACEINA